MKTKDKKNAGKKQDANTVHTPTPPQVMDPSRPPKEQEKEKPTKKKKSKEWEELKPKEEI